MSLKRDFDEMLDIDMEGVDPFNDEEIDRDVMKRAKSENKEDDADLNEKDKAKGDPVWEAWSFDCLCGQKVDSSAPKSKHPEGEQVCCGACNVWMHLNCLPEYKNTCNEDLPEDIVINCRRCQPNASPVLNLPTSVLIKVLEKLDFQTRKDCNLVCRALYESAVAAEHSVRIRHKSPDVARLMLVHYENATHVSLYCWHSSLHEFFSPEIKSITLISSAPMINLPNLPRTLEELMVHDPAVTDNSVMIALGRSGRTMSNLKVLNLTGTSVTGAFSPNLIPQSLHTLSLCCTPTSDAGLAVSICRPDDQARFGHLKSLDLSHTLVTNASLLQLPRKIELLNLSHTAVSMEGLVQYFSGPRLALKRLLLLGVKGLDKGKLKSLASSVQIIC